MGVANEMSVLYLLPSNVVGDRIGVIFKSQEEICHSSKGVANDPKGVGKLGLEWRCGGFGSVHYGKERFRDVACGVKVGWVGFESCHLAVCHFFAVAVIIGDGVEFFLG